MSHRSDALAAMRGEQPQRVPFIGRMNLWYNYHSARGTLPERYAGWSYFDVVRDLGIGILGFGDNLPPEALLSRVQWLVQFNAQHGSYPIRV